MLRGEGLSLKRPELQKEVSELLGQQEAPLSTEVEQRILAPGRNLSLIVKSPGLSLIAEMPNASRTDYCSQSSIESLLLVAISGLSQESTPDGQTLS